MSHILAPKETLQQVLDALSGIKRAWMNEVESSCNATRDTDRAIDKLRALLDAPCEPDLRVKSFAEEHPVNPSAKCKCEHWQSCKECHPTAHKETP
jgi:hypothetical protein